MKKIIPFIAALCFSLSAALASTPPVDDFSLEEDNISTEFQQLNKIEQYVEKNSASLEDIKNQNAELVENLDLSTDSAASFLAADLPLGIPAFWWGCVLGLIGILVVYIVTDQDKEQTKKALIGCLVFAGVWVIVWVIVAATGASFLFF